MPFYCCPWTGLPEGSSRALANGLLMVSAMALADSSGLTWLHTNELEQGCETGMQLGRSRLWDRAAPEDPAGAGSGCPPREEIESRGRKLR